MWLQVLVLPGNTLYLHKQVDKSQRWNDDSSYRCSQQNDDASPDHIKRGAHEHLDDGWDGRVNGVQLLGETVHQVPTGSALKEAHGRPEHVVQQVQVQVARGKDSSYWHHHGVAKHSNT